MASSYYCSLVLFCLLHQVAESELNFQSNNESEAGSFCSRKCSNIDEQPADEDIPRYQCSCSPSCAVYGDCCSDSSHKEINRPHTRGNFVCLSVVGHDRYAAVSGCPSNESSDFCKDGLGHLPPVTSRATQITYANAFCAKCNGDDHDLVTWNVELRCSSDVKADAKYIYKSGRIWSLSDDGESKVLCKYFTHYNDSSFMEGLELRSCTAYVRKTSHCSPSWKDESVFQMCRSYEDPVYFHNTAFKNVHCALCNYLNPEFVSCVPDHVKIVLDKGMIDLRVKKYCKTRGSDACIHYLRDKTKGRPYTFADLMNINEKGCVPPSGKRCCKGEAFDFRTQRCRTIRN